MAKGYAFTGFNEHMARAKGMSLPISLKFAIEVCRELRGRPVQRAKAILNDAIGLKRAIPFKTFHGDLAHKKKMGPGRYAVNACEEILLLLEAAEANAQYKGLNIGNLKITHIAASNAPKARKYGRMGGLEMKRTHVEIVLEETEKKKDEKAAKGKKAEKVDVKVKETAPVSAPKEEEHVKHEHHKEEKKEHKDAHPHKDTHNKSHEKKSEEKK